jgi:hypothetical protein
MSLTAANNGYCSSVLKERSVGTVVALSLAGLMVAGGALSGAWLLVPAGALLAAVYLADARRRRT